MKFWDSSAIVPLLLRETSTHGLQAVLEQDRDMLVWWATRIECASAIARHERKGTLDHATVNRALRRLEMLVDGWIEVQPGDDVRNLAQRLLRVHALRASDALQLAAALAGPGRDTQVIEMVCLDQRLTLAAEREGLRILC